MYPNAKITGGGTPAPDWRTNLPDALKTKVPDGADGYIKDGDVIIFTKNGEALQNGKFNADGSKYDPTKSDNANPEVRTPSGTSGSGNGGRTGGTGNGSSSSLFNMGFSNNTSGDIGASFINAGYTIDAEKFMGASMGFGAMSSLAQMMPFGLGAVFANNTLGAALNNFMKSVSFNFDFSNMKTRAEQEAEAAQDNEGATAGTETGSGSGSGQTVAELAKARGYTPTDTQGVYQNNGKFFKYDEKTKEFVECKADGSALDTAEAPATPSTPSTPSTPATPAKPETPATPSTPSTPATRRNSGNQGGYNVSQHSQNVFWKKSGGATHYYVKQDGKMVEISGYDGEKYTLNGKTYDAKTGKEITAAKPQAKPETKPKTQSRQSAGMASNLHLAHPQLNGNFRENAFIDALKRNNKQYTIETTGTGNVYKYENADGKRMEVRFDKSGKPTQVKTYSNSLGDVYDISYHSNGQRKHMTHGAISSASNVVWEDWSYDANGRTTDYVKGVRTRNNSWENGQVYRSSHTWKGGSQTVRTIPKQVLNGGSGVNYKEGDHLTWSRSGNNFVRKDSATGETWTFDKNGKLIKVEKKNGDVKTFNASGWTYRKKGY